MKNCTGCKYAQWDKTKTDKPHPSGDGRCLYIVQIPALPPSMSWSSSGVPRAFGGHINRRAEMERDCPYYGRG